MSTIAFLGTGEMNGAILAGLLAGGTPASDVRATTRSAASAQKLAAEHPGLTVYSAEETPDANARALAGADLALLGVKPQEMTALEAECAGALEERTVVVSVAAGVDLQTLEGPLPEGQPVVRTMPNLGTRVGRGVISVTPGAHATEEHVALVREVFKNSGVVVEVAEEQIGAVIGVSGSGPAYAFFLAEAMQKAGEALGLDADTARVLAKETVAGAGELLHADGAVPEELKDMVCSAGGTTERAVAQLEQGGLVELVGRAAQAARDRNEEMTAQNRG